MDGRRESTSDNRKIYLTFLSIGSLVLLGWMNSYCSSKYDGGSATRVERRVEMSLGDADRLENNNHERSINYVINRR